MGIAEFLNARLDEDEQTAQTADGDGCGLWEARGHTLDLCQYEVEVHPSSAAHIARHDPARVLREIAAKRTVLAAYSEHADLDTEDPEPEYADGHARALGLAVRHMAAIWSDHPDYDPAWAPRT